MAEIKVDLTKFNEFTDKLGTLHRSAYPNAVRGTLNSAAFDMKQNTMLKSAKHKFINRTPNFFKANSRVEQAKGWTVNGMTSTIGMVSLKGNNKAVDDLEQQEHGGTIRGRSFIPIKSARIGGSNAKNVQKKSRIGGIKNIVRAKNARGKSPRQRLVKSAVYAGAGGHVLSERGILWRINSMQRVKGGKWVFKMTPIHSFKKGRSVKVRATHFMEHAAKLTAKKIPLFFKKESERQFAKHLKV